jgi:hypothetical protein
MISSTKESNITSQRSEYKIRNDDDSASIQDFNTESSGSTDSSTIDYRQAFETFFGACLGIGISDVEEKLNQKRKEGRLHSSA